MTKASRKISETCPMLARSDWGVSHVQSKGLSHSLSLAQSPVGFHGPKVAGWLVFLNGCHRGEDMRLPIGESKLGSSWINDCVITGVGIGSQHAIIAMGMGEGAITPAAGNRVVKINNSPINARQSLTDGCLVTIGEIHCIFRLADAFEPGYTTKISPSPTNMPSQVLPLEMVCGWLVISSGAFLGQDFRLINGECRVGSSSGMEVTIPDVHLAKHALTLSVTRNECRIVSVHDGVRLRVNGVEIQTNFALRDSDRLQIDHLEAYIKWLRD